MADAALGDRIRRYGMDDWFFEGTVVKIEDSVVHVDFDDWIQGYPQGSFRRTYEFHLPVTVAIVEGVRVQDFCLD